ncbi:MAG: hypothetical protein ABI599_14195 [Flavobacteriales bacterium]
MDWSFLSSIVWKGHYLAYAVWTVLAILIARDLLKGDRHLLKVHVLYLINSGTFLLAYGMILHLALIVLGPKDIDVLRQRADEYFQELALFAGCALAVLTVGNFLYLKFLAKANIRRHSIALLAFNAVILFAAAYVSSELYFQGLRSDIRL